MKSRFNKIVIPTLAICLGAALAGSISGTVAWYQYSTRASTAYLGTSAGTSGNLKLRIKDSGGDWTTQLTKEAISAYLGADKKVSPVTSGNMEKDAPLSGLYKNPIRSFSEKVVGYDKGWLDADESMYVQIPLEFCYVEKDGKIDVESQETQDEKFIAKDVYLSDLLIQADYQNDNENDLLDKKDLSDAIRVHLSSSYEEIGANDQMEAKTTNKLISKKGGTILTAGHLDLDGDTKDDEVSVGTDPGAKYGFGSGTTTELVTYGEGEQTSFSTDYDVKDSTYRKLDATEDTPEKIYPAVVESEEDGVTLKEDNLTYGVTENEQTTEFNKKIGRTFDSASQGEQKYLEVVVTIWLEGWQGLEPVADDPDTQEDESNPGTIWDATDYIGSMFDIGMQFAVQAE